MERGPYIDFVIPVRFNLAYYYLEENLARGRGEKTAVYYENGAYTYNELVALTNKVGNVLKGLGLLVEQRVLLVLQDSPEWLAAWFGVMKIGAVVTHAHTYLLPAEYGYFLHYLRPQVVIADATTADRVREGARNSKLPKVILIAGQKVPALRKGEYSLSELIETASARLEAEPTARNDLAFWNFPGGTTGTPKGVPPMHHDGVPGFESYQYVVKVTPDDIVLRIPKLFFHYARDLGMNFPLRAGAAVALSAEQTSADLVFDMIERYRPSILINVPTMMRSMLQSPNAKRADLSCVRLCLASGEALSADLYRAFTERFGVEVLNVIGSAESFLGYLLDRPGEVVPGSSGKITPLVELKLVDDQDHGVAEGEAGVLWVRSESSGWMVSSRPREDEEDLHGPRLGQYERPVQTGRKRLLLEHGERGRPDQGERGLRDAFRGAAVCPVFARSAQDRAGENRQKSSSLSGTGRCALTGAMEFTRASPY